MRPDRGFQHPLIQVVEAARPHGFAARSLELASASRRVQQTPIKCILRENLIVQGLDRRPRTLPDAVGIELDRGCLLR